MHKNIRMLIAHCLVMRWGSYEWTLIVGQMNLNRRSVWPQ